MKEIGFELNEDAKCPVRTQERNCPRPDCTHKSLLVRLLSIVFRNASEQVRKLHALIPFEYHTDNRLVPRHLPQRPLIGASGNGLEIIDRSISLAAETIEVLIVSLHESRSDRDDFANVLRAPALKEKLA